MNNLAGVYWLTRKLDRSIPLFEEAVKPAQASLGPDHPDDPGTMAQLGVNYRDAGRLPEATALLEQAWEMARKQPGPLADPLAWIPRPWPTRTTRPAGSPGRVALPRGTRDDPQASRGGVVETAICWRRLGLNLLKQQKYAEAEPLLARVPEDPRAERAGRLEDLQHKSLLGGSLLGQKKYAEAEPLLLAGYEGMKRREEKIPPNRKVRLTEAIERLVQLYEATGKKDKADEWRKKLPVAKSASCPPTAAGPDWPAMIADDRFAPR